MCAAFAINASEPEIPDPMPNCLHPDTPQPETLNFGPF